MNKILIIDDETEICQLLTKRFQANGFSTFSANDGAQGLKCMRTEKPDVVVLDIGMQVMDGYTFVKEVRRHPDINQIPILILTAKDKMQDLFKMERIEHYFLKPFDIEKLLAKVKEIIKNDIQPQNA